MEDLQIRRRWRRRPRRMKLCSGMLGREVNRKNPRNHRSRQTSAQIRVPVMIERDLIAGAAWSLLAGNFGFAMPVRRAAVLCAAEHEVLFAGDASAPEERCDQQQGKQRTGERAPHHHF